MASEPWAATCGVLGQAGTLTVPGPSRFFYQFLLGNERATAKEIRDEYVETLSKIYLSYYRSYLGRLMKVQVRPWREKHSWRLGKGGQWETNVLWFCGQKWLPALFLFSPVRGSR